MRKLILITLLITTVTAYAGFSSGSRGGFSGGRSFSSGSYARSSYSSYRAPASSGFVRSSYSSPRSYSSYGSSQSYYRQPSTTIVNNHHYVSSGGGGGHFWSGFMGGYLGGMMSHPVVAQPVVANGYGNAGMIDGGYVQPYYNPAYSIFMTIISIAASILFCYLLVKIVKYVMKD